MESITTLISIALVPILSFVTGWASYRAGRRKTETDALSSMQQSINLLSSENTKLMKEVLELRTENLKIQEDMATITRENKELKAKIERLIKSQKKESNEK